MYARSNCRPRRQVQDLLRRRAEPEEVVQEEVVQLVRADRPLRWTAPSPRRDAGSSSGEISVATMSSRVRRASPSNSFSAAHRTRNLTSVFGHAHVRVVHAHVVGVVGAPAESQLGQVPRADHERRCSSAGSSGPAPARSRTSGRDAGRPAWPRASPSVPRRPARRAGCRTGRGRAPSSRPGKAAGCRSRGTGRRGPASGPWHWPASAAVVPKPGMVRARTFCAARRSRSSVLHRTSSESVESSPPETPMATGGVPICSSRRARPVT